MPGTWSRKEAEAAVAEYFGMLVQELRGEPYNKAEHNRHLQQATGRSHGSIERKHQNISAILIELGCPYIVGYKPLGNYQDLLRVVTAQRLSANDRLLTLIGSTVEKPALVPPTLRDLLAIQVAPPVRAETARHVQEHPLVERPPVWRNYLEIEARNHSLGRAGEELAVRFEQQRLRSIGEPNLAENVQLISQTIGDHLGYDVLSFERDGRKRLIEVKTTQFGAWTPFFASRSEVTVSEDRAHQYQLYRLFSFSSEPRLFALQGSLRKTCSLDPYTYSALPA